MVFWALSFTVALSLQADSAEKPAKELDPKDGQSIVEHAVFNTRSQQAYETAYKARWSSPSGAIDYDGRSIWVSPDVLFIHYTASGRDEKKIVRAGDKHVWIHNPVAGDWVTAEQCGDAGAGQGVQNPDVVLRAIAKQQGSAKLLKPGIVRVTLTGADIVAMLKDQIPKGTLDPAGSSAILDLTFDANCRIERISCDATVTDPNGVSRYTSDIKIVVYNGARELTFTDEKKRPIALHPEMKERIATVLNSRK